MKKPNILFIMSDQMRYDAIGYNGNKIIMTPNLDRLAKNGISFSNAFTPDPICVPARASITTGYYPHKCTGRKTNQGIIREGYPLLGEELGKKGYETYAVGKLHYTPYKPPGEKRTTHGLKTVELAESGRILARFDPDDKLRGLEDYHDYLHSVGWGGYSRGDGMGNNDIYPTSTPIPEEHFVDTWMADRVIYHLDKHLSENPGIPFFMWASSPKPHSAFNPPYPYDRMYDPRLMPDPVGDISLIKERGLEDVYLKYWNHMWDKLSPEAIRVIRAHYYGLVSLQDRQIGRLLDFIENKGLKDDTVIIYTADHGEMLGDFGVFFKYIFYDASVRIPLMISYPGMVPNGVVTDELAGLQDIFPTLMSLIREPLDAQLDGKDLTPILTGKGPVRDYYVSQYFDDPKQEYMVADKKWKYIYHQYGGIDELYNRIDDPCELNNLAGDSRSEIKSIQEKMKEYLIKWCIDNDDACMIQNGDLKKTPMVGIHELPKRNEAYGRRLY